MSLALSLSPFAVFPTIPSPGRTRKSDLRATRLKHIKCAGRRLVRGVSVKQLATDHEVSRRTINLWVKAALTYHDPEAEALRRLVDRHR